MAIKKVWVITCWYRDFDNSGYHDPSEQFFADTLEEAEQMKLELSEHMEYETVEISDEPENRDFF